MVAVIGEAAVAIRPETGGFNKPAEDGVLGAIGGIAKKATLLLGAAFAAGAVVDGLKGFYEAAAESAKIGRLTEQVIKSTGGAAQLSADQVGNLVTAISNKTGVDDEAIQSGANLLLTFTNIKNQAGAGNDIFTQTTQIMTDMAAALGTDASGSAVQLGKALNDPVRGVSALSKVGVSFTAQQKDQIAAMVAAGDTMGAQKVILAELGKEFGGAAEAASSPLDKLKVNLGNIQEAIGANLLPVVANFAEFATTTLLPAFTNVADVVKQAFTILFSGDFTGGPLSEDSGVVDTLFNIRDGFISFKDAVVAFVTGDTFAAWMQVAKDLAAQVWSGLQTLAGFINDTLVPAFLWVVATIGTVAEYFRQHQTAAEALGIAVGIVAALIVAAWTWQATQSAIQSVKSVLSWIAVATGSEVASDTAKKSTAQIVFGWVTMAAKATLNAIKMAASWVIGIVTPAAGALLAFGISVATYVGGWVLMGVQSLIQAAKMAAAWLIALGPVGIIIGIVIGLVALVIANWETVKNATVAVFTAIVDWIKGAWQWIKDAVSAGIQAIVDFFMNWTLIGIVIQHWDEIVAFISGAWTAIGDAVSAGIQAVVDFFTELPGKVWNALSSLGQTLWDLATAAWDLFDSAVDTAVQALITYITEFPGNFVAGLANLGAMLGDIATTAWQWFYDNVVTKVGELISFVTGLPGKIVSAVGNLGSLLLQKGKDLIQGLVDGIASAASFVGNTAKNVVNAVIGFVNDHIIDGINDLLEFSIMGITVNPPDIPHIPRLHEGGVFSSDGEGLALLRDQERVVTPEQRVIADRLLGDLLGGTLAAASAADSSGGVSVVNHVTQLPGEDGTVLAARVTQGTVWRLSTGVTRRIGAGAEAFA